MIKYFILIISGSPFSCTNNEASINISKTDSVKVHLGPDKDTIFNVETDALSLKSEITCPKCNFKKKETMPTDQCLLKYTCTNCKAELYPDEKDCCVFCTYGTHKCPSKQ